MIVLLSGYQVLLFAERLALPGSVPRVPRTPVFWIVWVASACSLVAIVYVPSLAHLFRVAMPAAARVTTAMVIGVASVAWRLIPRLARRGEAGSS